MTDNIAIRVYCRAASGFVADAQRKDLSDFGGFFPQLAIKYCRQVCCKELIVANVNRDGVDSRSGGFSILKTHQPGLFDC
ncbi:hypothetical protein GOD74_31040 [Sinorhizobium medicae]|nr:hypothetical protein [Sinorhizobium medicae]